MFNHFFRLTYTPIINACFIFLLLTGCATTHPPITLSDWSQGLTTHWLNIQQHQLVRLDKTASTKPHAIHIYLEGDGTPWVRRYFIAQDPSPRYPLALELMKRDDQISFYLGRPCYYLAPHFYEALAQNNIDSPCSFHYWTDARYSENVVELMSTALTDTLQQLPSEQQSLPIILIGHSGGGTLAMLIAQRVTAVDGVITIAANMDTDAWTKHQGYSPLKKSINPAKALAMRNIPQVHFAGENDDVVPPTINNHFMKKIGQELIVKKGFTHSCCWLKEWPELLQFATTKMGFKNLPQ